MQKILPFLSDTWPLCRIGRAVIRASQSCRQSCNKSNVLPAGAVLIIAALMHHNFLDHFPQESGGQFFKGKVLAEDVYKRQVASWGCIRSQGFGCSPIKAARELGSERRETVRSLSVAGAGDLMGAVLSTRGPGWTDLWCTSCRDT